MPTYGEIFTSQQANQNYGPVLTSVPIPAATIRSFLTLTKNYIMFKIVNGNVIVLGERRDIIYNPAQYVVTPQDVFTVYSTSAVNTLLDGATAINVYVEQRDSVLSISYGEQVLENGSYCPPMCPYND